MSASHPGGPNAEGQGAGGAPPADPSMEDILASIRRILSEDEPAQGAAQPAAPAARAGEAPPEVLNLQESMIVGDPPRPTPPSPTAPPPPAPAAAAHDDSPPPAAPEPPARAASPIDHLVAPEAEAAAAGSVSALLRTLVAGRDQVHVYRGGPTIEDLVREEIRPLLKTWLDANLPPIVERLVRAEIERVVGRAIP